MNICLAYESLLSVYQSDAVLPDAFVIGRGERVGRVLLPQPFVPSITRHEAEHLCESLGLDLPIHTLVTDAARRKTNTVLRSHVSGSPESEYVVQRVSHGLYLCSPEMLFVQMCSKYSFHEAVRLGFDLCGSYRRLGDRTLYGQQPRTTVERLSNYIDSLRNARGLVTARRVLRYVVGNSYSPRETDLAMKLGLPAVHGGEGLGMPEMNHEVILDEEASRMLGQVACKCDLYWPKEKVAVEYNGLEYHHGRDQSAHDRKREMALASMGIKVITVANEQLVDSSQFDFAAQQVAKALGKRIRHRSEAYSERRCELDALIRR